jgi:hypothetical protein
MDLQSFIQSGLLESYLLGQCTRGERALVEQMLAEHPEAVRAEMSAIEQALEGYVRSQAIAPPPGLKNQIMDAIEREGATAAPRSPSWLLPLSLLAVAALLAAAAWLFFQKNKMADENAALGKQVADIELRLQNCDQSNQDLRDIIQVLRDPGTRPIKIGSGGGADQKLQTYVFSNTNPERCKVLLDMAGLPSAEGGHLQMWALVGDVPQSMGMINLQVPGGIQEFDCVPNATAYAVSVEDRPEGNTTPKGPVILSGAL